MRIALFTETYLPVINGVVTHVSSLKEGLESKGHKVLIVTADSGVKKHETTGDVMYCPAVRLKSIYNYDVASPISMERLKLMRDFAPDIIHIHNEFGIGISGIVIAKFLRIPVVYTLHTMYEDYVYYVANKHFCKFITRLTHNYTRALAGTVGAITAPSQKVDVYFKKCGVKKDINIIPNPVELDKYDPNKIEQSDTIRLRKIYNYSDKDIVLCFCGRLGKEKNVTWLLEAIAKNVKADDGIKLFIIGGGPFYEQHMEEVKKLGLEKIVTFTGKIEHDETPPYYAMCDAYITASLTDTNSISMLEAMALGLPTIHIKDDLNAGQIIDGVNGFIYKDADELYSVLKKIKNMSAEEFLKLKQGARNSVAHQSSGRLAESIINIYETVIAERKNRKKMIW